MCFELPPANLYAYVPIAIIRSRDRAYLQAPNTSFPQKYAGIWVIGQGGINICDILS